MTLIEPSPKELVDKIVAFNNCWHTIRDDIRRETEHVSEDQQTMLRLLKTSIANLRDIKSRLQVQLLRHSSGIAELRYDPDEKREPCYSVALKERISKRDDACHIPIRIARRLLDADELKKLCVVSAPDTIEEDSNEFE